MRDGLSWVLQIGRRPRNGAASACWQKHSHMGFAAIDPHRKTREGLTIQGMCWISNRDFTRQLFKEWGILLCLMMRK